MATFKDLYIHPTTLHTIQTNFDFQEPTKIQKHVIPQALMGKDVLAFSPTGSGKTAAFLIPMVDILATTRSRAKLPRALIVVPTKEVAMQITEHLDALAKAHGLTYALIIGGLFVGTQIHNITKGVDVIIATPGRLLDLLEDRKMNMVDIRYLVLDEADRMFDMGFIDDIDKILSFLPQKKQILMFSATVSDSIYKLVQNYVQDPYEIFAEKASTKAASIDHYKILTNHKVNTLLSLIVQEKIQYGMIFCNRKADVDRIAKLLQQQKYKAEALHGDIQQHARFQIFNDFRDRKINLLVCSDVAGRGLDIKDVDVVINLDVPNNAEDYIHRIGRTGRAGQVGKAYILVNTRDKGSITKIEQLLQEHIPVFSMLNESSESSSKMNDRKKNYLPPKSYPTKINKDKKKNSTNKYSTTNNKPVQESHVASKPSLFKDTPYVPDFLK